MSYSLTIGFTEMPKDLAKSLSSMGFVLDKTMSANSTFPIEVESYRFFDHYKSKREVRFVYHNGKYQDHAESWQGIVDQPEKIVATGSVDTYMGRNDFDLKKLHQIARYIRDRFHAILYDPQSGQLIVD